MKTVTWELIGDGTPSGARRYRVDRDTVEACWKAGVGCEINLVGPEERGRPFGPLVVTRIDREAREVDLLSLP